VPDAVVDYVRKTEDPRDYRVSFTRIQSELGFHITMTVPDGIAEIVHLIQSGILRNLGDPALKN
jgi:hypothetical protein